MMGAQAANAITLLATAMANTALIRRFTFGVIGRDAMAKHQVQGPIVFGIALGLTSRTLAIAHAVQAAPPVWVEVTVLVVANAGATLLRRWVFRKS